MDSFKRRCPRGTVFSGASCACCAAAKRAELHALGVAVSERWKEPADSHTAEQLAACEEARMQTIARVDALKPEAQAPATQQAPTLADVLRSIPRAPETTQPLILGTTRTLAVEPVTIIRDRAGAERFYGAGRVPQWVLDLLELKLSTVPLTLKFGLEGTDANGSPVGGGE